MTKGPQGQKTLEEMSLGERLRFALACLVVAVGMGLIGWKNPYVQFYLHRFDPIESVVVFVVTIGALFLGVRYAPRT